MPKLGLHPLNKPSTISCACGNKVETFSTRGSFMVDICAACHPFYTGKQKFIDTGGRIDRFKRRYAVKGAEAPADATAAAKGAESTS